MKSYFNLRLHVTDTKFTDELIHRKAPALQSL